MDKAKTIVKWVLARLEEPSTWAGGSAAVVAVHILFPGALGDSLVAALAAIGGVLAIVYPEKA